MALSAEYYMVENQSIQTLLAARQKQIDMYVNYMNSMSLTAALFVNTVMGGTYSGMIQSYTSGDYLNTGDDRLNNFWNSPKWKPIWRERHDKEDLDYSLVQNYSFWVVILLASSAVVAAAGVHCILLATYLVVWTQRISLMGPAGSVARALASVRKLQNHVKFSFFVMLASFTVNCVASFWLCDLGVLGRSLISGIYAGTFVVTVYFLRTIYCEHYRYDKKHIGDGQGSSKGSGGLSQRMSLSGRRSVTAASQGAFGSSGKKRAEEEILSGLANSSDYFDNEFNKDMNHGSTHHLVDEQFKQTLQSDTQRAAQNAHMEGVLWKRSEKGVLGYQERYLVLEGHEFCYFKTKAQKDNGEDPEKKMVFNLDGYEVVVGSDAFSGNYDFSLVPMPASVAANKRTWEFRCKSEQERIRWVRGFLAAVLSINDEEAVSRNGRDTFVGDDEDRPVLDNSSSASTGSRIMNFFGSKKGGTTAKKKKTISFDLEGTGAEMT